MLDRRLSPWFAVSLLLLPLVASWPTTESSARTDPDRMSGTVERVEGKSRLVHVITGTGHALRVVSYHAPPDCRISVEGADVGLEKLTRGLIVVIRVRPGQGGREAESIETLRAPEAGRSR